jgi:hypothetical protein
MSNEQSAQVKFSGELLVEVLYINMKYYYVYMA